MPDNRDLYRNVAEQQKPASLQKKRQAPKRRLTKEEAAERQKRRGKATAWRLTPDTKPAIDRAAAKHKVNKGDLVDFLLRAGLHLVATGKIVLPLQNNEEAGPQYLIVIPPVPKEYQENSE